MKAKVPSINWLLYSNFSMHYWHIYILYVTSIKMNMNLREGMPKILNSCNSVTSNLRYGHVHDTEPPQKWQVEITTLACCAILINLGCEI